MKPIHKLNGGRGATLCHKCKKIITEGFTEDLYCEEHGGKKAEKYPIYELKKSTGAQWKGHNVLWLEWNENGSFRERHDEPNVGRSLILDPQFDTFQWMTTEIQEILEQREDYVKFRTRNSVYELFSILQK